MRHFSAILGQTSIGDEWKMGRKEGQGRRQQPKTLEAAEKWSVVTGYGRLIKAVRHGMQ